VTRTRAQARPAPPCSSIGKGRLVRRREFLTPPIDRGAEIRCYIRDPDGCLIEVGRATGLIEVGQATGLLEGKLAKKRPEDLPG
jgi:hypothetical protein